MIPPTVTEADGRFKFEWAGGLTIEATRLRRSRYGLDAELRVVALTADGGTTLGQTTLRLDDQSQRDRFSKSLEQRDGKVSDWPGHLLVVADYFRDHAIEPVHSKPVTVRVSDVDREDIHWRWANRQAKGKLHMVDGDPGVGKSILLCAIATGVTSGAPLPGDTERHEPENVLILSAEDGVADTIRPRLEDMGADLSRVTVLTAVIDEDGQERHPSLVDDLAALDEVLSAGSFGLVIVDPINAYLGTSLDTHRDAALRAVLTPLGKLAEKHNVVMDLVRHLTKGGADKAIYRGQGNIAYTAAARIGLLVARNPDDEEQRILACIKSNLGPTAPELSSMAFTITEGQFRWVGEVDIDPEAMLAPKANGQGETAVDEAEAFLREELADGPRPAKAVQRQGEALGHSARTLKRARKSLGVRAVPVHQAGKTGVQQWDWDLPPRQAPNQGSPTPIRADVTVQREAEDALGGQGDHPKEAGPLNTDSYLEGAVVDETVGPLNPDAPDDDDPDNLAALKAYATELAGHAGYGAVTCRSGQTILAGPEAWANFLLHAPEDQVVDAIAALELLA